MPVFNDNSDRYKRFIRSFTLSLSICSLLLILSCAAVYMTDDPGQIQKPVSVAALYVASFISGITAVRLNGGSIIASVMTGILLTVIVTVISVSYFKKETDLASSVLMHSLIVVSTVSGGLAGKKKRPRRDLKRKKRIRKS